MKTTSCCEYQNVDSSEFLIVLLSLILDKSVLIKEINLDEEPLDKVS